MIKDSVIQTLLQQANKSVMECRYAAALMIRNKIIKVGYNRHNYKRLNTDERPSILCD